jgi:NADPH2:quinone reductase
MAGASVQIGQSAGAEAPLTSAAIRGKMGEIYGYTDFAVAKDEFREQYLQLVAHAAAGEIVFDNKAYPFDRVAEAWERQANGPNAKIVVTLT